MWLVLIRVFVVLLLAHAGYVYLPSGERWLGLALGVLAALGLIALELKLRSVPGHHIVGALIGGVIGLFAARLVWGALSGLQIVGEHFVHVLLVVFLGYMGVVIGGAKGEWFEPARIIAAFRDSSRLHQYKVLDTSVIIDGRIADICETGFLEGTLVVPQFVLRELQQVADSSDSLKRNRGRRGLDILQKMQKMAHVVVQIVETDFPEIREVDLKLIELARKLGGKIVTNDFNLNKVAQLRGVPVLNINELANSLKPVVLPGELMKVFIIKEGKEAGQGVAYLDDGTMVVVDQAKKALGRTIEVSVTSVLQTTAGNSGPTRVWAIGATRATAAICACPSGARRTAGTVPGKGPSSPSHPARPCRPLRSARRWPSRRRTGLRVTGRPTSVRPAWEGPPSARPPSSSGPPARWSSRPGCCASSSRRCSSRS
jgi:uncharacterized protein YacL